MEQQHILEFSPDGKLFALINEHGILKIWDTETNELKQEYTPNLHLTSPCTCLTWLTIRQKKKSKKDHKSIENEPLTQFYLALGTSKGGVSLYSYALGKIDRNFQGDGHSGRVTSITYDQSNFIYTIGEDCNVIIWNINDEHQYKVFSLINNTEKPYSISYIKNTNQLLIGCKQILLYSCENYELQQQLNGHTSDIILLKTFTFNSIEYAITASKMERILCLWTLNKKSSKYKNPTCTFLMEDIAYCIDCKIDKDYHENGLVNNVNGKQDDDNEIDNVSDYKLKLIAVTRSGRIHAYVIPMASIKSEKPVKPTVTIEISSDDSNIVEPLQAVTASLHFKSGDKEILFGYGDKHFLLFEHVTLNFADKVQILIRNDPKKLYMKNKQQIQQDNLLKTLTPIVTNDVEYHSSTIMPKKKMKQIQMPMETRLENLHLTNGEIPQAQSKVQLLIQALHSKDSNLLTTVLSTKDPKVIQLTLQKLPVQYIEGLVNELTVLMQKKRSNVQTAAAWLKVLIKTHTSQLMAFGSNDLFEKFGPCLGIIEYRTNCLKELSKLSGRLQLLVNQIKRNTEEEENLYNENVLIYEDKDSIGSDLEEEIEERSLSNDEWDENKSLEEDEDENENEEENKMDIDEENDDNDHDDDSDD